MRVVNKTRNSILAENAVIADTSFKRVRGLLGKSGLGEGEALVLKPCNSIHTFFMSFPIDVVFVDSQKRVAKTISNMSPFRISGIYFKANLTIELPAGTISKTSTQPGDLLEF